MGKASLVTQIGRAFPRAILVSSWITYLATIVWWETASHPELFLRYGNGKETVYLVGGLMVVLATMFSLCLGSPRSLSWRWGTCLILLLWTLPACILWTIEMQKRYWREEDYMEQGFEYLALLYLGVFGQVLSLVLAGLFRLFSPSNWVAHRQPFPGALRVVSVWMWSGGVFFFLWVAYHLQLGTALLLLALGFALLCLIEMRLRSRPD